VLRTGGETKDREREKFGTHCFHEGLLRKVPWNKKNNSGIEEWAGTTRNIFGGLRVEGGRRDSWARQKKTENAKVTLNTTPACGSKREKLNGKYQRSGKP